MNWTPDKILEMAKRMETRPNGFRVSAKTAPLIIEAIRVYAKEHCGERLPGSASAYAIDVWDPAGNSITERIAQVGNLDVARVAYAAACKVRPGLPVTLRQGIRVVQSNDGERR